MVSMQIKLSMEKMWSKITKDREVVHTGTSRQVLTMSQTGKLKPKELRSGLRILFQISSSGSKTPTWSSKSTTRTQRVPLISLTKL